MSDTDAYQTALDQSLNFDLFGSTLKVEANRNKQEQLNLILSNVPFRIDDISLLASLKAQFNGIEKATIVINKFSNRSEGYAYIGFGENKAAMEAVFKVGEIELLGR